MINNKTFGMAHLYILYSSLKNKFYVGSTSDELTERLRRHNSNHSGYTGNVNDWEIVYTESFMDYSEALKREKEIKKMKSRLYIENLTRKA